jgi:hypothetical protein
MGFFQKSLLFLPLLLASGLVTSGSALAEACTYGEAIMALEQGNTVRGMVLMRMANRDGDERANRYLVLGGHQFGKIEMTARNLSQQPLLSLNRVNP